MAKSDEPITIKKYANRRLYNTGTSTYVTLEDLATMVKAGENFVVYDAKTNEDITRSVLTQIIFEQENKEGGQNLLPINFLRQLIRFYGDSMQMMVPRYLEVSIDSLTKEQAKFREQISTAFGMGGFGAIEDQVRRNMEMFERTFSMFAPFARQGSESAAAEPDKADKPAASGAAAKSTTSSARWKRCRSASTASATRTSNHSSIIPDVETLTGRAFRPAPGVRRSPGGDSKSGRAGTSSVVLRRVATVTSRSGVAERQRDEARSVAGLHPHQHVGAAVALGVGQHLAHLADTGDGLAADVEDDVTGLQAMLGRGAVGVDAGDHQALAAGAGDRRRPEPASARDAARCPRTAAIPHRPWPACRSASAEA